VFMARSSGADRRVAPALAIALCVAPIASALGLWGAFPTGPSDQLRALASLLGGAADDTRSEHRVPYGAQLHPRHPTTTRLGRRYNTTTGRPARTTPLGSSPSIARVSVDSSGNQGNGTSRLASLSADGRYVAFESQAHNLAPGDTNQCADIFVHDCQTGEATRVSVDSAGNEGNRKSHVASISADGRYVAFESQADNLVPGDTNGCTDVFVYDCQTGQTIRASVGSAGNQGSDQSHHPSLNADGRYVAFQSRADNLVFGDTNGTWDIFVYDSQTGQTSRVSVDSAGNQGNDGSVGVHSLSTDGRYVAFDSLAGNLVPGDTNQCADIFVHDCQTGQTTRASVDSAGNQGGNTSQGAYLTADGQYVAFHSYAPNLVPGDTNGCADIFVHDCQTGKTTRVSVDSAGDQGSGASYSPSLSADGHYVAFDSYADNLVPGDTNGSCDVFVVAVAPWHIEGTITQEGSPVPGVLVWVTEDPTRADDPREAHVHTDSAGRYAVMGVRPATYCLTPAKAGLRFSPPDQTVAVGSTQTTADFEGWVHREADGHTTYRAVLVGVNDYPPGVPDLDFSDDNVWDLRNVLLTASNWDADNIATLVDVWNDDPHPSARAVRSAVMDMGRAADGDDVCLLYISSHAGAEDDSTWIGDEVDPKDECIVLTDESRTALQWVSDDRIAVWLNKLGTERSLFILEACRAGGHLPERYRDLTTALLGTLVSGRTGEVSADLHHGWKGVVMAACEEYGSASNEPGLLNSAFTCFLVQGLRRQKADTDADGWVSAEEAFQHARDETVAWAHDHDFHQLPLFYQGSPGAFPLLGRTRDRRLDVRVRRPGDHEWTGDNVYSDGGDGQEVTASVIPGQKQFYHVSIQNDRQAWREGAIVTGVPGQRGWEIKYFDSWQEGKDVTDSVTGRGWRLPPIDPNEEVAMRVEVMPAPWLREGASNSLLVSARPPSLGLIDTVKATTQVVTIREPRPDARVWYEGVWLGDDIYNQQGYNQTARGEVEPQGRAVYRVSAQNDQDAADTLRIKGPASNGRWDVRYLDAGGRDITADVVGAGWLTPTLGPGDHTRIRVILRAGAGADPGTKKAAFVGVGRAGWGESRFSQRADTVKLVTEVAPSGTAAACQVAGLSAASTAGGAQITFSLSSAAQVQARILNIAGRPIRTLCLAKDCEAGTNTLLWNAQSDQGLRVRSLFPLLTLMPGFIRLMSR